MTGCEVLFLNIAIWDEAMASRHPTGILDSAQLPPLLLHGRNVLITAGDWESIEFLREKIGMISGLEHPLLLNRYLDTPKLVSESFKITNTDNWRQLIEVGSHEKFYAPQYKGGHDYKGSSSKTGNRERSKWLRQRKGKALRDARKNNRKNKATKTRRK